MKQTIISTGLILVMMLSGAAPALAQSAQEIVCQHNPNRAECESADQNAVLGIIDTITDLLLWVMGIGAVVVIIVAGFIYTTSGGSPDRTKRAREAIIYSLVGVVVAAAAKIIVQFALGAV
ncbi:MAG: hypothetical protein WD467_02010 [Candidatus Saccharimonadales bacterium]